MTVTFAQLLLYASALLILFLTPGPVWVALIARSISGGFHSAWPLALGVAVGDAMWPLVAIFGVSYLVALYADFLILLRYFGAAIFLFMGGMLIWKPVKTLRADSRLTAPGLWAGFLAGVMVIVGNPKAILFYLGVLPGFFDFGALNRFDVVAICITSLAVPMLGNIIFAFFVDKVRLLLTTPGAIRKMNTGAGVALILVGLVIALS
jgi:threonine/homoserine/homoserine lactone efflux protein